MATRSQNGRPSRTPKVAIVGAGMSGICMGIKLKQAGIDSFTIYEKAARVGGTWRENTYPGLECDVPSRFYSLLVRAEPGLDASTTRPGARSSAYFEGVADRYGMHSHTRFGKEVERAEFEDGRWRITMRDGEEIEADFLISALRRAAPSRAIRSSPGSRALPATCSTRRAGITACALDGRRIGMIGTGSTGVQITCALSQVAGRLEIFQRTAQWVVPRTEPELSRRSRGGSCAASRSLNRLSYRFWQKYFEHADRTRGGRSPAGSAGSSTRSAG